MWGCTVWKGVCTGRVWLWSCARGCVHLSSLFDQPPLQWHGGTLQAAPPAAGKPGRSLSSLLALADVRLCVYDTAGDNDDDHHHDEAEEEEDEEEEEEQV